MKTTAIYKYIVFEYRPGSGSATGILPFDRWGLWDRMRTVTQAVRGLSEILVRSFRSPPPVIAEGKE